MAINYSISKDNLELLEKASDAELLEIIQQIRDILEKRRHIHKCQWERDEGKTAIKPCDSHGIECTYCPFFYSDDDARWA